MVQNFGQEPITLVRTVSVGKAACTINLRSDSSHLKSFKLHVKQGCFLLCGGLAKEPQLLSPFLLNFKTLKGNCLLRLFCLDLSAGQESNRLSLSSLAPTYDILGSAFTMQMLWTAEITLKCVLSASSKEHGGMGVTEAGLGFVCVSVTKFWKPFLAKMISRKVLSSTSLPPPPPFWWPHPPGSVLWFWHSVAQITIKPWVLLTRKSSPCGVLINTVRNLDCYGENDLRKGGGRHSGGRREAVRREVGGSLEETSGHFHICSITKWTANHKRVRILFLIESVISIGGKKRERKKQTQRNGGERERLETNINSHCKHFSTQ